MFAAFVGKARGRRRDSLQLRQRLPRCLRAGTMLTPDERRMTGGYCAGQATRPNHHSDRNPANAAISAPIPAKINAISASSFSPTNLVLMVE